MPASMHNLSAGAGPQSRGPIAGGWTARVTQEKEVHVAVVQVAHSLALLAVERPYALTDHSHDVNGIHCPCRPAAELVRSVNSAEQARFVSRGYTHGNVLGHRRKHVAVVLASLELAVAKALLECSNGRVLRKVFRNWHSS